MNRIQRMLLMGNRTPSQIYIDFSTAPNGSVPGFGGATWAIASGKAVNTPNLGNDQMTDPTFEGTFTAGKNNQINSTGGAPTLALSADAHSPVQAQSFTATAQTDSIGRNIAAAVGSWWHFEEWAKASRTDGFISAYFENGTAFLNSLAYAKIVMDGPVFSSGFPTAYFCEESHASIWPTILIDDAHLQPFTFSELLNLYPLAMPANTMASVNIAALQSGSVVGIGYNWNAAKTSGILIYFGWGNRAVKIYVDKYVNGTRTSVTSVALDLTAGAELRVYRIGNIVYVDYDHIILTSATISDATIINNQYFGIFSTNPANHISSYSARPIDSYSHLFAVGDSKTVGVADSPATAGWATLLAGLLGWNLFPARYAVSGWTAALAATFIASNPIPTDTASGWAVINLGVNDTASMPAQATFKSNYTAIIDAIHASLPNYKILCDLIWAQGQNTNCDTIDGWITDVIATRSTFAFAGIDERIILKGSDNGASETSDGWHPVHAAHLAEANGLKTLMGY